MSKVVTAERSTATGISTIRLADIVIDLSIQHREPEQFTINQYRQALRAGAKFPSLIVEKSTKRLVCGHQRYLAYRAEMEPAASVSCIYETYPSELALWERAVSDNIAHGRPLDTWDKKRILLKMQRLGATREAVAALLNLPLDKIEEWNGEMVVIVGVRNGTQYEEFAPAKRGVSWEAGKRVSEEQYDAMVCGASGIEAKRLARRLRDALRRNWVDKDDEDTIAELRKLYVVLGEFLVEEGE